MKGRPLLEAGCWCGCRGTGQPIALLARCARCAHLHPRILQEQLRRALRDARALERLGILEDVVDQEPPAIARRTR